MLDPRVYGSSCTRMLHSLSPHAALSSPGPAAPEPRSLLTGAPSPQLPLLTHSPEPQAAPDLPPSLPPCLPGDSPLCQQYRSSTPTPAVERGAELMRAAPAKEEGSWPSGSSFLSPCWENTSLGCHHLPECWLTSHDLC